MAASSGSPAILSVPEAEIPTLDKLSQSLKPSGRRLRRRSVKCWVFNLPNEILRALRIQKFAGLPSSDLLAAKGGIGKNRSDHYERNEKLLQHNVATSVSQRIRLVLDGISASAVFHYSS